MGLDNRGLRQSAAFTRTETTKAETDMTTMETENPGDYAYTCSCGSVQFHLLKSREIACVECGAVHIRLMWCINFVEKEPVFDYKKPPVYNS